ncbi:hypothetical protein CC1G_05770 [Coprinopsis cinerea okayama7|uniref:Uncharacterized protein n=1 Tax=Coprinopsis cinerea (strain Okayama-7 / 130 / ATCC MYA-4618 / FGSC 9003) TaxID=240176 RepID=A8NL90_COPC7|nr:hypothetical protein CC1G_05770 [Coprinopsis cinerea okayama7\|eukprot:XP_001834633.1 hypothetical protein CC1G_05770 [Coprinopsis cinerea okayama7\
MEVDQGLFTAFLTMHMFGALGSLIVLLTAALSPSIPRHATWYSFMFSWFLSSTSYSLLLLTGNKDNPRPPYALCVTQASLIYAALPMTTGTVIAVVLQVYFNVKNWMSDTEHRANPILLRALIAAPYCMHLAMFIGSLVVGLKHPETVQRPSNGFFCNYVIRIPSRISSISVAVLTIPTIVLQGMTFWALKRNWMLLRGSILRVLSFSFFGVVAIVLGIVFATGSAQGPAFLNVIVATVPVAAVLIFGSQKDILNTWMFWREKKKYISRPAGFKPDNSTRSFGLNSTKKSTQDIELDWANPHADLPELRFGHGKDGPRDIKISQPNPAAIRVQFEHHRRF